MTVKELYRMCRGHLFIRGYGSGYPVREYPKEFTTRELKDLANKEVMSIRGTSEFPMFDSVIEITV